MAEPARKTAAPERRGERHLEQSARASATAAEAQILRLQRTAGNTAVQQLLAGGAASVRQQSGARVALQRQIETERLNDADALLSLRSEQLFSLYVPKQPRQSIGALRYEAAWLKSAEGTRALQNAIRHHLDQKVRQGGRDDLDYFLRFVERMAGDEERLTWLRNAVSYRLQQAESAEAREAAGAVEEFGAAAATAIASTFGAPEPLARFIAGRGGSFGAGVWEGVGRRIDEDELGDLGGRFALAWGLSIAANPVFLVGVSAGIWEWGWNTARALYPLLTREGFNQMVEGGVDLAVQLCGESGGATAYRLGVHVGSSSARRIEETLRSAWWQLPFQLGRLVGPIVFEAFLMLFGGEGVVVSAIAREIAPLVSRYPKLARALEGTAETAEGARVGEAVAETGAAAPRLRPAGERTAVPADAPEAGGAGGHGAELAPALESGRAPTIRGSPTVRVGAPGTPGLPPALAHLAGVSRSPISVGDAAGGTGWRLVRLRTGDSFEAFGRADKHGFRWMARVPEQDWEWAQRGNQLVPEWYVGRADLAPVEMVRYRIVMSTDVDAAMSRVADQELAMGRLGPAKFQYFHPDGFESFSRIEPVETVTILLPSR